MPYIRDSLHCDSISVPGGRVADLTRAFKAKFAGHPLPVDAICVLAYNDILNPPLPAGDSGWRGGGTVGIH